MSRYRVLLFFTALLLIPVLPGCFIPEKFESSLHVNEDGSYVFKFDGSLAYAPALQKLNQNKNTLTQEDENKLKEMAQNDNWPSEFKTFSYTGRGRYDLAVEKQGKAGEDYVFITKDIPLITISHEADGTIRVENRKYGQKDLNTLKEMGVKTDGHFELSTGPGVKVLEHNARKKPAFWGLIGNYEWAFESLDDDLMITIAPPQ